LATAPRRDQAGLDKLRAIIQGNLGFIFATPLGRVRPHMAQSSTVRGAGLRMDISWKVLI
jgi:hypothetical protein